MSIFHISSHLYHHPYTTSHMPHYLFEANNCLGRAWAHAVWFICKWPKISLPSKFLITFLCLLWQIIKNGKPQIAFARESNVFWGNWAREYYWNNISRSLITLVVISFSQFTTNRSKTKITIDSKLEKIVSNTTFWRLLLSREHIFHVLALFFLWYTKEHSKRLPKHSTSVLRTLATTTLRLPMSVIWKPDNYKTLIWLLIRFFLFYYQSPGRCCIKLPIKTITRNTSGDWDDHNRLVRTVVKILMG